MTHVRVLIGASVVALGSALFFPPEALSQATKAGVVTTLQGTATVARSTAAQPAALRFKDDVFIRDHIVTGDSSLVRILLGGKAVVTVRERSALTIHETATTSTIAITEGKIALAVAKERMKPGEAVQIKTPNGVAGVRGTVVVAEVTPPTQGSTITTRFTLLTGIVDVTRLDAGQPTGSVTMLHPLQTVAVVGNLPPGAVRAISRAEAHTIAKDYKVSLPAPPPPANAQVLEGQIEHAMQQAAALNGQGAVARAADDRRGPSDDKGRDDDSGNDQGDDGDHGKGTGKGSVKADKGERKDADKGDKDGGKGVGVGKGQIAAGGGGVSVAGGGGPSGIGGVGAGGGVTGAGGGIGSGGDIGGGKHKKSK
jgi:hypothetical protein